MKFAQLIDRIDAFVTRIEIENRVYEMTRNTK